VITQIDFEPRLTEHPTVEIDYRGNVQLSGSCRALTQK